MVFETMDWRATGTVILRALDDVQALLDDQIIKTQSMRASPFIGPFEERVRLWEAKLNLTQVGGLGQRVSCTVVAHSLWALAEGKGRCPSGGFHLSTLPVWSRHTLHFTGIDLAGLVGMSNAKHKRAKVRNLEQATGYAVLIKSLWVHDEDIKLGFHSRVMSVGQMFVGAGHQQ